MLANAIDPIMCMGIASTMIMAKIEVLRGYPIWSVFTDLSTFIAPINHLGRARNTFTR